MEKKTLAQRLEAHPELHDRISRLIDVVDNAAGDVDLADAAEKKVVEELRQMGNEALHAWAKKQSDKKKHEFSLKNTGVKKEIKKNCSG